MSNGMGHCPLVHQDTTAVSLGLASPRLSMPKSMYETTIYFIKEKNNNSKRENDRERKGVVACICRPVIYIC